MPEENKDSKDNKTDDKVDDKDSKETKDSSKDEDTSFEDDEKFEISGEEQVLLAALRDPKQAKKVVSLLANQVGLDLGDKPSKKISPTIEAELKAALGEDYAFLAPGISRVLGGRLKTLEQKFSDELDDIKTTTNSKDVSRAEKNFFSENPDAKKYHRKMITRAGEYPMPEGKDPREYIEDLYTLVSGSKVGKSIAETERARRIKKNQEESGDELSSSGADEENFQEVSGPITKRAAIEAAMKGIRLKQKG